MAGVLILEFALEHGYLCSRLIGGKLVGLTGGLEFVGELADLFVEKCYLTLKFAE